MGDRVGARQRWKRPFDLPIPPMRVEEYHMPKDIFPSSHKTPKSKPSTKRPTTRGIPDAVKTDVAARVEHFNTTVIRNPQCVYVPRYRGKFLYLDRQDYGRLSPISRLEYTGKMEEWSFAIYKYSDEHYDEEEWFFPGSEHVDGTIEGAMKAGLETYPA
jgi:hypothetical protein